MCHFTALAQKEKKGTEREPGLPPWGYIKKRCVLLSNIVLRRQKVISPKEYHTNVPCKRTYTKLLVVRCSGRV